MFLLRFWRLYRFKAVMFQKSGFIFCCIFWFYCFYFLKIFLYINQGTGGGRGGTTCRAECGRR